MIMKKIYISPVTEIVEVSYQQTLLAGSIPSLGNDYDGGAVLAPESEEVLEISLEELY